MEPLIPYYQVPVFHLGPVAIHGFGILVALGFWLGGNAAMRRARETGLDPEAINKLLTYLILGTFIGGHVGYGLMYAPAEYFADPVKFLYFWQGLSSFGGFLVCVPLSFWFFRKYKLPIWPYMDSLAFGLGLGWFLGRLGCTVAHDHPGTPSDFWLAKYCRPTEGHTIELPSFMVDADHGDLRWGPCLDSGPPAPTISDQVPAGFDGVLAAHDMGFYEALWSLGVFLLFLAMQRWRPWKPGVFFFLIWTLYGPTRFAMDYLRPETTDGRWFAGTMAAMTPGQFWSFLFFVFAAMGLVWRLLSDDRPVGPDAPVTEEEGGGLRFPRPETTRR